MSSNYSAQVQVEYNKYLNTIRTTHVSDPGAPKPYPNLLLRVDAFKDAIKVSGYSRMKVFFDPEYYKVYKNDKSAALAGSNREVSVDFLRVNPDIDTYKIHMINLDLQKDKIINIRIADKSGSPLSQSPASFSKDNLSFEYGDF